MPTSTLRIAVYARISHDPLGLELGVTRQLEDCRALAAANGWTIVAEHTDNDISAMRRSRPAYEALMADASSGRIDAIVTYMTSRMWRNRRQRAEAIEILAKARVSVYPVKGPALDLSTASGRMVAGLLGEVDTHESEIKGERVARAALQRAQQGRANGPVLYGWKREYQVDERGRVTASEDREDPEQAEIVREIVRRLLDRESIKAIRDDLNTRGVSSPGGKSPWHASSVAKIARRPANIGLRVHGGEVIGPAAWPAIVDDSDHAQVIALLDDPRRRTSRDSRRRYLLTYGIGHCGVCGDVLRLVNKHARGGELYVCDSNDCVGRRRERVDELVEAAVVAVCTAEGISAVTAPDVRLHLMRAEALRARLESAADAFAAGTITMDQLERVTASLRPELAEAERRSQAASSPGVADAAAVDSREAWDSLTVAAKRDVMRALGMTVHIDRTRPGPGFDPYSVRIEWPEDDKKRAPAGR